MAREATTAPARGPARSRPPRRRRGGGASNSDGPIASTVAASGSTIVTAAPRRRRTSASAPAVVRANARVAPRRSRASRGVAVGFRHSTSVPARTGAASRLAALHTPPSTYSRPPIVWGRKTHGTAQEASTASVTLASGAPGAPKITRLPLRRSTAATRSRPSKRAPSRSSAARSCGISRVGVAPARSSGGAQGGPAGRQGGGGRGRDRRRQRAGEPARARPGAAGRPGPAVVCDGGRRRGGLLVRARRGGAVLPRAHHGAGGLRPPAAGEHGGHDRAGRGADEVLRLAQIPAGLRLDTGQQRAQPGLAQHAAASEHEHVRSLHRRQDRSAASIKGSDPLSGLDSSPECCRTGGTCV